MKLVMVPVLVLCGLGCGGSGATSHVDSGRPGTGGSIAVGTGGAAGARAVGGAGGTDAAVDRPVVNISCQVRDAGADGPGSATGQFSVVYADGGPTSCLTTCSSCTAFYSPPYGNVELVMETPAYPSDTTNLYVTIGPGFQGVRYQATLELIQGNLSFPMMYQGVFSGSATNIGPGSCIMLSSVDLASGGGVSGTFDCDLQGQGVDNDQTTVHVTGTFSGLFP